MTLGLLLTGYRSKRISMRENWQAMKEKREKNGAHCTYYAECATFFNSSLIDSNLYAFAALSRPVSRTTGTMGVSPVDSTFAYNSRSEVVSATIGTNFFAHAYDDIGNQTLFGDNATTNTFTHNQLNQLVWRVVLNAPPTAFTYTPDGGLASDGTWSYAYDAEDQLISVTSSALTNGAIRVLNTYDYRHRRTAKSVQRLNLATALPPSPPITTQEWETTETRTFVYDDWNLIHETVYTVDRDVTNVTEIQYFWGLDLSGTIQGAGGVGGLLAVSRNGQLYFPANDNNGNVTKYIDESGNVVAAYEYDDFGRTISQLGSLAEFFRHRFSTKYCDPETGLYYYGYRFYFPDWRIWLNRDPIEEGGGVNLYEFSGNASVMSFDVLGQENYCHCFQYAITVMRRYNWKSPWHAVYRHIPVTNGSVVQWNTEKFLWINLDYIEQITVTVTPKTYDCICGKGSPRELNYRPKVFIDGPFSLRIDGKVKGESVWETRADISGKWTYDKTASQNVIKRKVGTRIPYNVIVTDGHENVCGTMSFVISY